MRKGLSAPGNAMVSTVMKIMSMVALSPCSWVDRHGSWHTDDYADTVQQLPHILNMSSERASMMAFATLPSGTWEHSHTAAAAAQQPRRS
mmetsp:Transcript_46611/g.77050  ORF Transcript_46611/g.77050 Transcript_46611/m.77050 type:complete len:90 (+) Transcript_46611:101-370(+)